jgi:hypothetical protein
MQNGERPRRRRDRPRTALSRDRAAMSWLERLDLIRFFEFYLAVIFVVSTALRVHQYRAVVALLGAMPGRWPRLLQVIGRYHTMFLTWETFLPGALALGLLGVHTTACHWIWPHARLTVADLLQLRPAVPIVAVLGVAMTAFDVYTMVRVGQIDRALIEKHFDQAEYWLRSWTAPVVRVVTLGYVNPRQMVSEEVHKALRELHRLLNSTLWWITIQTGLRIAYGLAVWLTFAFSGR